MNHLEIRREREYTITLTEGQLEALVECVGNDVEEFIDHQLSSMRTELYGLTTRDKENYQALVDNYFILIDNIESAVRKLNSADK